MVAEDGATLPPFQAGQYVNLFVEIDGVSTARPYAISSAPSQHQYYNLTVKRAQGGFVSNYLLDHVAAGQHLLSSGPMGIGRDGRGLRVMPSHYYQDISNDELNSLIAYPLQNFQAIGTTRRWHRAIASACLCQLLRDLVASALRSIDSWNAYFPMAWDERRLAYAGSMVSECW